MGDYYKVPANRKFLMKQNFCDWYVVANKNRKDVKK